MTANVSIITEKSEDVLCAPNVSLKFTPQVDGPKYQTQGVWLLDRNRPRRIDIKQGASDDAKFEIISDEINEGSEVVVGGNNPKDKRKSNKKSSIFILDFIYF